jgi:hypothetical protein
MADCSSGKDALRSEMPDDHSESGDGDDDQSESGDGDPRLRRRPLLDGVLGSIPGCALVLPPCTC